MPAARLPPTAHWRPRAREVTLQGMIGTSAYVHFPWCLRKCPYCDFATSPCERDQLPHERYADALIRDLESRDPLGGPLVSVFFGGGTPSLWSAAALGRVLAAITARFSARASEIEVTVECNPSSLDAAQAQALREVGVNRLSVGVQSLADAELSFLGRLHDGAGALRALEAALGTGLRVSADLIFGLPGQAPEGFLDHVTRLLELGLEHVSAYSLTIEPATRFGELSRKGLLTEAPDEDHARAFSETEALFVSRGFSHYEVSNYARAGQESLHNLHYWRGGAYVGLGAAAVGCEPIGTGARRYRNHPDAQRYMERAGSRATVFEERLDEDAVIREALMLGLRTREGVDLARLAKRTGRDPLHGREREVERLVKRGDLELENDRMAVPATRWLMLDGIVARLF